MEGETCASFEATDAGHGCRPRDAYTKLAPQGRSQRWGRQAGVLLAPRAELLLAASPLS